MFCLKCVLGSLKTGWAVDGSSPLAWQMKIERTAAGYVKVIILISIVFSLPHISDLRNASVAYRYFLRDYKCNISNRFYYLSGRKN